MTVKITMTFTASKEWIDENLDEIKMDIESGKAQRELTEFDEKGNKLVRVKAAYEVVKK